MDAGDRITLVDGPGARAVQGPPPWRILVVDDDEEVHQATRYALRKAEVLGRHLEMRHTYSAQETMALLERDRDFALVLLDVVMESTQAGLTLVEFMREHCDMKACRIILRTGQPGYAPELPIFNAYDINDYRTKSELTVTRLVTAVTAALRSYDQIRTIAESRRGLEMIVRAAADLMDRHAMLSFAEGVLTQLAALLGLPLDGIVCAHRGRPEQGELAELFYVIGAAGQFSGHIGQPLEQMVDAHVREVVGRCLRERRHVFAAATTVLYVHAESHEAAVYLKTDRGLSEVDRQLVEVFASNIAACFGNVHLIAELNRVAYVDPLTRLGNRAQFLLDVADAQGSPGQVLVAMDIRHFSEINHGLGHSLGDALLQAVAHRLSLSLPRGCAVSRIAGDVFAIVGPAASLALPVLAALFEAPLAVGEHRLTPAFSMARHALAAQDSDAGTALQRLILALEEAKSHPDRPQQQFEPRMEERVRERLSLLSRLREDFEARRLEVWYQPQIHLSDGRLLSIEALLRWPDGQGGMVQGPQVFVPLAEQSGLITPLGTWVLERAAKDWRELQALPRAPARVAVNVSMAQFRSGDLVETVQRVIGRHDMPRGALEIEVTESIAMDEPHLVVGVLQALRELGVRIAIDDFGTGYSSLSRLRELPIDCLKIDQAFVSQIGSAQGDVYAETIVRLSQRIGMETIAEGVETRQQEQFLAQLGCDISQGWCNGRAMPLQALKDWMAQRN